MGTIFGSGLAGTSAPAAPPWPHTLGGVAVHFVSLATPCGTPIAPPTLTCDLVANLVYVSPTQINFVVPDISAASYGQQALFLDVVLNRDGAQFDSHFTFYVSPSGDFAMFQVGYDCMFSLSLAHPEACGYSLSSGQYRVPIGAVTDVAGRLISSQNPVHQGQVLTLWATGFGGLTLDAKTGLLSRAAPQKSHSACFS